MGFEQNECCLWVSAGALSAEKVKWEPEGAGIDSDPCSCSSRPEAVQVVCIPDGSSTSDESVFRRAVLQLLELKYEEALSNGFSGLRVCMVLENPGKSVLFYVESYRKVLEELGSEKNIVFLYACPFWALSLSETLDLLTGQCVVIKKDGNWTFLNHPAGREWRLPAGLLPRFIQREKGLESIYLNSPVIAFIWKAGKGFPIEFVSENIIRFGYTVEDFTSGRLVYEDIVHPEDLDDFRTMCLKCAEKGDSYFRKEYRIIARSGEVRWVDERSLIERIKNDEITHYQGIIIDITEQKKAVEALQRSEKKFREIFEHSNDAVAIYDLEGRILEVNRVTCKRMGYTKEEFLEMSVKNLAIPKYSPEIRYQIKLTKQSGHSIFEVKSRCKDGTVIPHEINNSIIDFEGKPAVLSIGRDITEHKRGERALKDSEQKYRMLFECSPIGIFHFDPNGVITHCNESFAVIVGGRKTDIVGLNFMKALNDNKMKKALESALSGESGHYEGDYRSVTGNKTITVKVNYSPLVSDEGSLLGGIGIFEDITERKKAEDALKASEQKYSSLVEKGNDGILILQDQLVKFANTKMFELMGYTEKETIGKKFTEFIHEDYRKSLLEIYERQLKNGPNLPKRYELELLTKKRRMIPFELNPSLIEYEGRPAVMAILRDITDRRRVEAMQQEKTRFLQNLVDAIPAPVYYKSKNGVYIGCNRAFEEFIGKEKKSILGQPAYDFTPKNITDLHYPTDLELIDKQGTLVYETSLGHADGKIHHMAFHKVVFRGISEDDSVLLGIMWDITERKELEETLRKAKKDAESASRAKSEFIMNMSHELRTPLNAVIGFSDVLRDQAFGGLNAKQARYIDNILKSGKHLLEIVNNLLDISRIECGTFELQYEPVSIDATIEENLKVLSPLASNKSITLESHFDPGLEYIHADRKRFTSILYNLLSNAVKFTPQGGKVTVETFKRDGIAEIKVTDTGIGISKEDLERIFQPFVQVDSFFSKEFEGTGLGLSIVKRFVELHGGHVRVESTPGKGSTFTVTLPCKIEQACNA
ncbi:PAS domain S-box protein [Methanosarcina sp. KYL-1]|nr:PAS domain S-box protein [Methanosarcina sp. KYL-1]